MGKPRRRGSVPQQLNDEFKIFVRNFVDDETHVTLKKFFSDDCKVVVRDVKVDKSSKGLYAFVWLND